MKLTPSSTARRKTFFAFSRSGGQPQIPSPVRRIAPKPSRLTKRSPPNWNVESRASGTAARILCNPPVRTPAALAESAVKNLRRVTSLCIESPFLLHPSSFVESSVKTPAAPAEIAPKNVLRLIAGKICCPDQLSTLTCSPRDEPAVVGRAVALPKAEHSTISWL